MTTRIRKTFQYSEEDDEDLDRDDLDDEEQETLIATLRERDVSSTEFYKKAFLALPLLSSLIFVPIFFAPRSSRQVLLALLSITSLASTAYILHFIPLPARRDRDVKGKRPVYQLQQHGQSPIHRSLPWLNAALSAVLTIAALLACRRARIDEAWRGFLPGAVFVVTMFARQQLVPLDIEGLEKLRYQYKGA